MTQAPASPPQAALDRFGELMRELLQLDLADLDFGIYRLLNARRAEVEAFLSEDLPRRVDEAFASMTESGRDAASADAQRLAQRAREALGDDAFLTGDQPNPTYSATPSMRAYVAARERLDGITATDEQKAEVFILSRYYDAGDFIPHRRYGRHEAYAVPYNGEETLFHWVNRDQHYVKTGEQFRDYAFRIAGSEVQVRFSLASATMARDNTKDDTRYFFPLADEAAWNAEANGLTVPFEYRLPTETELTGQTGAKFQEALLTDAVQAIADHVPDSTARGALLGPDPNRPGDDAPLLLRHLRHFAKRNTTDYFIHRDLGGFLRDELEFYLKDQVVHLADLDGDLGPRQRMLRVVRELAGVIIGFLAEIEDAQRRLFEKRKFVLRTDYLVTMRCIDRDLWPRIAANQDQRRAWLELFAIEPDEIGTDEAAFSAFFESHPTLVVDTRHFDEAFRDDLLATFDDLDGMTDGLLVHGENYQALRLLSPTLAGKVKCIYIDPPYNTGNDGFIYKDRYRHSSWLAMMSDRLRLARDFLTASGAIFISIDDNEAQTLRMLLDDAFDENQFIAQIVVQANKGGQDYLPIAKTHEYLMCYAQGDAARAIHEVDRGTSHLSFADTQGPYEPRELRNRNPRFHRGNRPNLYYTIYINPERADAHGYSAVSLEPRPGYRVETVPRNSNRADSCWRWGRAKVAANIANDDPDASEVVAKQTRAGNWNIYEKNRRTTQKAKTVWDETEVRTEAGTREVRELFGKAVYDHPKPVALVRKAIQIGSGEEDTILDFFAGSGTTADATIQQNRQDGGHRRFCIVEMGAHFHKVVLKRVTRVAYTPEWSDGKPARLPTAEEVERSPRIMKATRVEAYDDSLRNVEVPSYRSMAHGFFDAAVDGGAALLHTQQLERPFRYEIEVVTDVGPRTQKVDLVETFNLAYGVHVERIQVWTNELDGRRYRAVVGHKDGHRLLILWRDMVEPPLDPQVERTFLEERIERGTYDEVLINGDSAVPGVASLDPIFKRLIEEEDR